MELRHWQEIFRAYRIRLSLLVLIMCRYRLLFCLA
jgi:hypothetical protein